MFESQPLQKQVAEYARLLHEREWVANHDGNVSVRLGDDKRFLATPTAVSKRKISPHDLVCVDISGKILSGRNRIFSEWNLHAACYQARPDARAVIHAHAPYVSAFSLAHQSFGIPAMPEVVVSLGVEIPLIPFALPKSKEQEQWISEKISNRRADAFLIAGNGVFTMGDDLEQAYLRLELVEHYAKIVYISRGFGGPVSISNAGIEQLLLARQKAGLGPVQ